MVSSFSLKAYFLYMYSPQLCNNYHYYHRYYVVRQLLVLNGESFVKDLINSPLNFLVPENIQQSLAGYSVPDVYVAFQSQTYSDTLAAINSMISAVDNEDKLKAVIQHVITVSLTQI